MNDRLAGNSRYSGRICMGWVLDSVALDDALAARIDAMLAEQGLARLALVAIVAPASAIGESALEEAAQALDVSLRFVDADSSAPADAATLLGRALRVAHTLRPASNGLACAVASHPVVPATLGRARGRLTVLGLAEGGMDWVVDDNNRALITPEMETKAAALAAGIAAGEIRVHDSSLDGPCPVQ